VHLKDFCFWQALASLRPFLGSLDKPVHVWLYCARGLRCRVWTGGRKDDSRTINIIDANGLL
jgi:hypothetical protein